MKSESHAPMTPHELWIFCSEPLCDHPASSLLNVIREININKAKAENTNNATSRNPSIAFSSITAAILTNSHKQILLKHHYRGLFGSFTLIAFCLTPFYTAKIFVIFVNHFAKIVILRQTKHAQALQTAPSGSRYLPFYGNIHAHGELV